MLQYLLGFASLEWSSWVFAAAQDGRCKPSHTTLLSAIIVSTYANARIFTFSGLLKIVNQWQSRCLALVLLSVACSVWSVQAATLIGWAEMPMHTYANGPSAGQFNHDGPVDEKKQPIQGFSAVLKGNDAHSFYFLTDNGFGEKRNSADALLRLYAVEIEFAQAKRQRSAVRVIKHLDFNDAHRRIGFPIQADYKHYYNIQTNPAVDDTVKQGRLLTGADIDPESIVVDNKQRLWVGDEFGPFLVAFDMQGAVLDKVIALPNVASPDNPYLHGAQSNISPSAGFEAMAINPAGNVLYALLENAVNGDDEKTLRLYEFDIVLNKYRDGYFLYQLEKEATNVTDMVAINAHQFLVLERNTAITTQDHAFKKVFLIDTQAVKQGEAVHKQLLVDLMHIEDPDDLNGDSLSTYSFAYSHVEDLLVLDPTTILVANDNNYHGRTYFIKLRLDQPLNLQANHAAYVSSASWKDTQQSESSINFGDHTFFGWMTVLMYFIACCRTGYQAKVTKANKESGFFWLGLTVLLLVLGLNKQLDLQTYLTDWLRDAAKAHGWYEQRRGYQLLFIMIMGLAIPILLISLRMFLYRSWQNYKITWFGIVLLLIFVLVRAASFHHVDMVFYQAIGSLRYYQALEILAIMVIIVGSFIYRQPSSFPPTVPNEKTLTNTGYYEASTEGADVFCPRCATKAVAKAVHGRPFKCKYCAHKYLVYVNQ